MFTIHLRSREINQTKQIRGTRCMIGSGGSADVVLASWKVQKEHAELFVSNEQLFVRDLGSMFGTLVDGKKIATFGPLGNQHQIAIGGFELQVQWQRHLPNGHGGGGNTSGSGAALAADQQAPKAAGGSGKHSGATVAAATHSVNGHGNNGHDEAQAGAIEEALAALRGNKKAPARQQQSAPAVPPPPGASAASGRALAPPARSFGQADPQEQEQWRPETAPVVDQERLALRRTLQDKLIASFDLRRIDVHKMSDQQLREQAESALREILRGQTLPAGIDSDALIEEVRDEAIGLGLLEPLLADPGITEIMVNAYDEIFIERGGQLIRMPMAFSSEQSVMGIIERIVAPVGRRIDESSPLVDARLKDGSRFNAIIPPLALKGPSMTIRKFATKKLTGDDLIAYGSCSENMVKFMHVAVQFKKNVIVSGGTGSGKSTLLNILSNFIPDDERIVTIEDAAELRLHHEHLVTLESRPANAEGKGAVTIRDLVRNSLRMRPDRIVVGECRGGEALDMLQAMNTGHDGSLTTAHANSPRDMLTRLEVMVLMSGMELPVAAIREQVASAIDVVIQQTRYACGSRKISRICEVTGVESGKIQLQDLFEFVETGFGPDGKVQGYFTGCGAVPEFYERVQATGIHLDVSIFQKEQ
ncbi:MAG: Flp pilus assembly complex ATPase component TadA [Burkholderiaceae bacterium]|jgi:pilus assembly protein CpaF|nr:Flp pilus assembly complex ATPase component TadA [Burkholderiaceae bacterium]